MRIKDIKFKQVIFCEKEVRSHYQKFYSRHRLNEIEERIEGLKCIQLF